MKTKGKAASRRGWDKSQILAFIVVAAGIIITQECFVLMYLCIRLGYSSAAAWLTAAVGLGEAVIAAGLTAYLSLCKVDHSEGGITYAAAKAKGFTETDDSEDSPAI
jgi:hypothetical protein